MKKYLFYIPLISVILLSSSCGKQHDYQRKMNFNEGWKFHYGDIPEAKDPSFQDEEWQNLTLPHDWAIEYPVAESNPSGTANGYFVGGVGWYRKSFDIEKKLDGQAIYLLFDGIFMDSEIWLNGNYKGKRNYGYINHVYDISEDLIYGEENTISVRVDNSIQPSDRWYHGCGIFRDVELVVANPVHVKPWGTFIRTSSFDPSESEIKITTEIVNNHDSPQKIKLISHIYHPKDGKVDVVNTGDIEVDEYISIDQTVSVENPDLWSVDNPVVYECVTDILTPGNTILDTYITEFGIRNAEFTPEKGFVLNGEKLMMKGVCLHHDLGATGAAYYPSLMKRRLEVLKEAGVNAIRLSHNPYDPHVLELCDKMGFVVIDELYDKWEKEWWMEDPFRKPFMETWEKDLTNFVLRDRNHPSVVLWSTGNETMEQLQDPERGLEIIKMLNTKFRELDPTRPITCAMHPHGELPSRLIHETDVVSYNYQVEMFDEWRNEYPDYIFLGSETKVYQEGKVESWKKLDFSKNTWFMLSEADAGQFIWAGIDYFGESRGWPDKGIRTGFINTCGFIKPYGQFQRSIYSEEPMVHITILDEQKRKELEALDTWQILWYGPPLVSHWNHDKDSVELYIFSNQEKVEIYLNEELYSTSYPGEFPGGVINLKVPYKKGEIRAVAYTNEKTSEHTLRTAGKPSKIYAERIEYPDASDYDGVVQFVVSVRDESGTLCHVSDFEITAEYDENLIFLGADNGDMSDHQLFTEDTRTVRDGRCLFVFKRKEPGKSFFLEFQSEGLESLQAGSIL
jgi:beta-galactosidase